jgi:hypothetical protein
MLLIGMKSNLILTIATVMLVATIGITTMTTAVLAENPKDATPPNTWGNGK